MRDFDKEKSKAQLQALSLMFGGTTPYRIAVKAIERVEELEGREEELLTCFDCGKKVDQVDPHENKLGEIHFDPGSLGGRYEPPEPACAYFVCAECLKDEQAKEIAALQERIKGLEKEADCTDIFDALEGAGVTMEDGEQPQDPVTAIEILGGRIEKLTEALIEERAMFIAYFSPHNRPEMVCNWEHESESDKEAYRDEARQQLRHEGVLPK